MPWIQPDGSLEDIPTDIHLCTEVETTNLQDLLSKPALQFTFTNPAEGRPFSWCAKLRRLGYTKPIVAGGEPGLDKLAYAFRCGFTLAWITDAEKQLLQPIHLKPFNQSYQPDAS